MLKEIENDEIITRQIQHLINDAIRDYYERNRILPDRPSKVSIVREAQCLENWY
jgi:hypothetical protein